MSLDSGTCEIQDSSKRALRVAQKLSRTIQEPDLKRLLLDEGNTYEEAARNLLSAENLSRSLEVSVGAVRIAAKKYLDSNKLLVIGSRNQVKGRERARVSSKKNYPAQTLVEATEPRISWTDAETQRLLQLAGNLEFQYQEHVLKKGQPNYNLIARQLNREFHSGKAVRDNRKCYEIAKYVRGRQEGDARRIAWTEQEQQRFQQLVKTVLHPKGSNNPGKPDFRVITAMINDEFHGGKAQRTLISCRHRYSELLEKHRTLTSH